MNVAAVFMALAFTACGGDEGKDEPAGNSGGASDEAWYTSGFATAADFEEINVAIDNHELLSSSRYHEVYAEVESFLSEDGGWNSFDWYLGRLCEAGPDGWSEVIHIVDDTKIEIYGLHLYKDTGTTNSKGERRIYRFNAGRHFGKMAYYGSPSTYFYVKTGNKIAVSNGNIYALTAEGLIGRSGNIMPPFKPNF